eukprot:TRINITY_DN4134_c0_g1_i2.p1 TRINITY_DN4134_c0_g1~~TRINITY_DN4134_c0_g1_i2.p1  ORF type:complete len:105 (-),score=32.21 TRINITY_DN4134_c0_g1_i2:60-374(-)
MCIRDSINAEYGDSNRRLMAEQSLRAMTDEDLDTVLRVQELCYPPALRESRSTFQAMREAYPRCFPACAALPVSACLLYTSDAADEEDSVDLGGPRRIKKNNRY